MVAAPVAVAMDGVLRVDSQYSDVRRVACLLLVLVCGRHAKNERVAP